MRHQAIMWPWFAVKGKLSSHIKTCSSHQAAVIRLSGLTVAWGLSVGFTTTFVINIILCLTFPVTERHRPLSLAPKDPAPLSAALNINTCLRGPVNARYRGKHWKNEPNGAFLPCAWRWKVGQRRRGHKIEKRHKCKGIWKEPCGGSDDCPCVAAVVGLLTYLKLRNVLNRTSSSAAINLCLPARGTEE